MGGVGLARFLGWLSIGLGSAALLGSGRLARSLGLADRAALVRGFGLRELVNGAAILREPASAPRVWARVGGDVLDLATLATALPYGRAQNRNLRVAVAAVAGVALLDVACGLMLSGRGRIDPRWRSAR